VAHYVSPFDYGNATEGWKVRVYPAWSFEAYCYLPISVRLVLEHRIGPLNVTNLLKGSYGLLPRVLFYFTIVFALVGWGHKWLIAGALAATLVYSGQAAIHACLLAWSRQAHGENDIYALAAILSTSAILAVPLLNWSKSIRDLSIGKKDDSGKSEFSKARTIIVYWGLLVVLGLFSVMVLLESSHPQKLGFYSMMGSLGGETISCVMKSSPSQYANLTFDPPLLQYNYNQDGLNLSVPLIDAAWANAHGCSTPCKALASTLGPAIFRQADDYQLVSLSQVVKAFEVPGRISGEERLTNRFQSFVLVWSIFVIPYIILQGVMAAAFGRRTPTQARDALYIFVRDGRRPQGSLPPANSGVRPHRKLLAKWLALATYAWALFVTIICVPVLILSMFATESYLFGLPQSESATSIGSWSPWAGTALVLIAALISKFHNRFVAAIRGIWGAQSFRDIARGFHKSSLRGVKHLSLPILQFLYATPTFEWKSFRRFWHDADSAIWFNRHGRLLTPPLGPDQMRAVQTVGSLPVNLSTVVPRRSWLIVDKQGNLDSDVDTVAIVTEVNHSLATTRSQLSNTGALPATVDTGLGRTPESKPT
jgi:hypothetical protein